MNELIQFAKTLSTYLTSIISPEYAKAVGLVGAIVTIVLKFVTSKGRRRNQIKRDLEILKMMDRNDPGYTIISHAISRSIEKLYSPPRIIVNNWPKLISCSLFSSCFAAWGLYLSRNGFSWWSIIPGFFSLVLIGFIVESFGETEYTNENKENTDNTVASESKQSEEDKTTGNNPDQSLKRTRKKRMPAT